MSSRFPAERVRLSQWQCEIAEKLKAGGPIAISAEAARFLVADLKKAEDRLLADERQADPAIVKSVKPAQETGSATLSLSPSTVGEGEAAALDAFRLDEDWEWAIERVTSMCASALLDAQVYRQKLLKGFGYPNETFARAQDYRALNIVLERLKREGAVPLDASHVRLSCRHCLFTGPIACPGCGSHEGLLQPAQM
jgi:hypothetical protein